MDRLQVLGLLLQLQKLRGSSTCQLMPVSLNRLWNIADSAWVIYVFSPGEVVNANKKSYTDIYLTSGVGLGEFHAH